MPTPQAGASPGRLRDQPRALLPGDKGRPHLRPVPPPGACGTSPGPPPWGVRGAHTSGRCHLQGAWGTSPGPASLGGRGAPTPHTGVFPPGACGTSPRPSSLGSRGTQTSGWCLPPGTCGTSPGHSSLGDKGAHTLGWCLPQDRPRALLPGDQAPTPGRLPRPEGAQCPLRCPSPGPFLRPSSDPVSSFDPVSLKMQETSQGPRGGSK